MTEAQTIQDKVLALQVYLGCLAARRKVSATVQEDTDADITHVSQDVLACDEWESLQAAQNRVRAYLRSGTHTLPCPIRGIYLVPIALYPEVSARLSAFEVELRTLAEALAQRIPDLIEDGRARRRELFAEGDYPDPQRVRDRYRLERRWLEIRAAEGLAAISAEAMDSERARVQALWAEAEAEIVSTLRGRFAALVGHLAERLTPGPDGKAQRFRKDSIEGLLEFCDSFQHLNVANDKELASLIEQARGLADGLDARALRGMGSEGYRASIAASFGAITSAASSLLEARPGRMIES